MCITVFQHIIKSECICMARFSNNCHTCFTETRTYFTETLTYSPTSDKENLPDDRQEETLEEPHSREEPILLWSAQGMGFNDQHGQSVIVHYISCHLADAFIHSDSQFIRPSRRHTPWSNVGLRAFCSRVQQLWPHQGSNHRLAGPSQVA